MSRIYIPSAGPDDWQAFLAEPQKHWVTGYSARSLAHAWDAPAPPAEVMRVLEASYGALDFLLGLPEHKTPLPGGRRESQTDLLAMFRSTRGLLVCAVEGKVNEPFGSTVEEWMIDASPGKRERLAYILDLLGLAGADVSSIAYQLLHRTAASLIEARRFAACDACMLVHSFSPEKRWFDAFERFGALFGVHPKADGLVDLPVGSDVRLKIGWVCGDQQWRQR